MLEHRLISAVRLTIPAVFAFLVPGWPGGVLFLAICAWAIVTMVDEFFNLVESFAGTGYRHFTAAYAFVWVVAIALPQLVDIPGNLHVVSADVAGILGFLLLGFVRTLLSRRDYKEKVRRLFLSLACLICLIWPLSFIPRLFFSSGVEYSGRFLALFAVVVIKCTDVGAYAVGSLTARLPRGNQKIIPHVSPNKSWEGFAGGIVAGIVAAIAGYLMLKSHLTMNGVPAVTLMSACLFGAIAGVLGFVGDICESMFKRAGEAKDSGDIPGLGGLLDVLDSLILAVPAAYIMFRIVAGQ